jgi:emfourin
VREDDRVKVRIQRRGGFAGNISVSAELDTTTLTGDGAGRLDQAVAGLPWGRPAAPPSHPDAFRYEITLPDEPDRGTAVLGEAEAGDDALVPLMDRLAQAGTLDG